MHVALLVWQVVKIAIVRRPHVQGQPISNNYLCRHRMHNQSNVDLPKVAMSAEVGQSK